MKITCICKTEIWSLFWTQNTHKNILLKKLVLGHDAVSLRFAFFIMHSINFSLQRIRYLLKPTKDRDNYIKATYNDVRMNGGADVGGEGV